MTEKMRGKPLASRKPDSERDSGHFLILFNDDINSFDYVIESLMEVCGHSSIQAEQCTFIAHYKGFCEIKKGERKTLESMQINLVKKGLKAAIE